MSLRQRLHDHPVVVEVVPPRAGASPKQVEHALALVGEVLTGVDVDAVNVPEILGSGFQGMDALEFGLQVRDRFAVPVIANKVTVHRPRAELAAWMERAVRSELASVILVGGERSGIYYPGPGVLEGNRLLREVAQAQGRPEFPIGNITIPSRTRESLRMREKARAGADYFTSQIIYESAKANAHLQAYDDVCALSHEAPRPVLYAFSPAQTLQDVLFLRYLGVHIPPEVEARVLAAEGDPGAAPAREVILDVWTRLVDMARRRGVRVPLGVVVEPVSAHNAPVVAPLVRELRGGLARLTATATG